MTAKELQMEKLLLLGIAKLYSAQSTFLIGELKQQIKMRFNIANNSVDAFISEVEKGLNEYDFETLDLLTETLNDGMATLRKELITIKNQDAN